MDAMHRTTFQYVYTINPEYFPVAQWIHNPNLSAVAGIPKKYWVVTGDVITAMNTAQRNAVDTAELTASRDQIANAIDRPSTYDRAFAEILLSEINILRAALSLAPRTLAQLKTALRNNLDA